MDPDTRLRQVFAECLLDENGNAPPDPTAGRRGETSGWDSVTHLQLVARIEECFSVELDIDDIVELESYADAVSILRKLGAEVGA